MSEVESKAAAKPARAARGKAAAREKQIAAAEALAAMLADAPAESSDPLAPPAMIADPRMRAAVQVWRDRAPALARLGCLTGGDRLAFALMCVYVADFAAAQNELLDNGFTHKVPTVSGGFMLRENPAVRRRDTAAQMILQLSANFGMTPVDRYKLLALRARTPDVDRDLFGDEPAFDRPAAAPAAVVRKADDGAPVASPTRWDELLGPRAKPN